MQFHALPQEIFTRFSHNCHKILLNIGYFRPFWANLNIMGVKKAFTPAEEVIGGTGRGCRPPEGAKGPKKESENLKRDQRPPKSLYKS